MIWLRVFENFKILKKGNYNANLVKSFSHKIEEKTLKYEPVIGLEVHAQINTESKLFSHASTEFLSRPNSQATFFDISLPGTLPILNRRCVELAIKTALATNCRVSSKSSFDRKHYFYGDMPNGYQITQQFNPIARDGFLEFIVYDDYFEKDHKFQPYLKRCRLKQIQLEQDSGKSLADNELNVNFIDLNRAGVPLMEFVFEPDLRSPLEAISLVRELVSILKAIGSCSCKMEEGALRVDANISIRPVNTVKLGTRTEIKNLNSFRFLREASEFEIKRQALLLDQGQKIINETLGYDFRTKQTYVMRDKEVVQDYRFMPEPNLPPIILDDDKSKNDNQNLINIENIRKSLPELPEQIRQNLLLNPYCLSLREVYFLLNDSLFLKLFYEVFYSSQRKNGSECFEFIQRFLKPLFGENVDPVSMLPLTLTSSKLSMKTITEVIKEEHLAQLCDMLHSKEISETTVLDILKLYIQRKADRKTPKQFVEEYNWWLIEDMERIEKVCQEVIKQIPKIAQKYAKTGVRKPKSMLIQKACALLNNQVNDNVLWDVFDSILRKDSKKSL